MPCPYFEPLTVVEHTKHREIRLPLLGEFDGRCHAGPDATTTPEAFRFRCNHGYSRGVCDRFPADERRSGMRYHLNRRTASALSVLCIEEENYAPARWHEVDYVIAADRVEPEIEDLCVRAQVVAFCRAYLQRFADES